ncbi:hypothetical protein BpHYR1_026633 [Brachionus plicatilis]|uniref:Uncharacterized protein n=1 Tax=Brachionus plicatilis TaxID=10195 RepID=A0A3M7PB79_BRAPC|nr:hypothetical protein BpHYR1_026633 [Brachionus plicatilis]
MTQSCPDISLTQFKKPIRDCYLMIHDVGGGIRSFNSSTIVYTFSLTIGLNVILEYNIHEHRSAFKNLAFFRDYDILQFSKLHQLSWSAKTLQI